MIGSHWAFFYRAVTTLAGAAAFAASSGVRAEEVPARIVPSYGEFAPIAGFAIQPDPKLEYKVLFSVSSKSKDPKEVHGSLARVARFVNILGAAGVRPKPGDIVAIVYSAGTPTVVTDELYAKVANVKANPNLPLIRELQATGVTVAVCAQSLAGHKFDGKSVAPGVRIDASAITTIATLQLKGWAYMPD